MFLVDVSLILLFGSVRIFLLDMGVSKELQNQTDRMACIDFEPIFCDETLIFFQLLLVMKFTIHVTYLFIGHKLALFLDVTFYLSTPLAIENTSVTFMNLDVSAYDPQTLLESNLVLIQAAALNIQFSPLHQEFDMFTRFYKCIHAVITGYSRLWHW